MPSSRARSPRSRSSSTKRGSSSKIRPSPRERSSLPDSEVARSANSIEIAEGRLAKIRQASRGTAEDLSHEFSFEDDVVQAGLHEARARLELEKAKARLDVLRKYVRPKRVKELKSEVEKARSDELAKQARWELEKAKLKKLQEATKAKDRETHEKQRADAFGPGRSRSRNSSRPSSIRRRKTGNLANNSARKSPT